MKQTFIIFLMAIWVCASYGASAKKSSAKSPAVSTQTLEREGRDAVLSYDLEGIDKVIEKWEKIIKNGAEPSELRSLRNRSIAISNMLGRVEKITLVDWLTVDSTDFFNNYKLSADAGVISGTSQRTQYTPASGVEVFFTAPDSAGHLAIMHADVLDDGTRVKPQRVNIETEKGSDSAYPFMATDGTTLYFANNADTEASLGGYDLYMTRRDEKGDFLEPVNMGMPYNSPGNDYLYVLDDQTGLGWWATDRAAEPGKVSIFVFIPNETRVNYPADMDNIVDYAFITSVKDTQPKDFNDTKYSVILDNIDKQNNAKKGNSDGFTPISLANGKVYYSAEQFKAAGSVELLNAYNQAKMQLEEEQERLQSLRNDFGEGNVMLRKEILTAEKKIKGLQATVQKRLNAVINNEIKNNNGRK